MSRTPLSLALATIVVLVGLLVSSGTSSAITGILANVPPGKCWQNGNANCYHWARTAPGLTMSVENDVAPAWALLYYSQALSDWSFTADPPLTPAVDSVTLTMLPLSAYASGAKCGGLSGLVRMCSRAYGFNGWLGLASIWVANDGEHIVAGTVKLNDSYFNTATYNTAAWRNLVSCQELAHTLGLGHEDENFTNGNLGSCMDYTNDPSTNQYPSLADKLTLANMYAHADAPPPASGGGNGRGNGQGLGLDEDALPPGAGPQHGDTFVRRLPNGMTLITHVFWVRPGHQSR